MDGPRMASTFFHLQTLKMPYYFEEFPREISSLINLRHICFGKFVKVPAGILGRLTNLRSFPFLRVGEERGSTMIKELGGLTQLRVTMSILSLEHVTDGEEAKTAKLAEKNGIRKLNLKWKLNRPRSNVENEESVLEALQPHSNLELLEIKGFMGAKFPSWLMQCNNLKEIKLSGCNKFEGVPVLAHLLNLRHIKIKNLQNLRCLGSETYGRDTINKRATTSEKMTVLFPALKILHVKKAENHAELIGAKFLPGERSRDFPCLEELILKRCNKFRSAPSHFPSLKKLVTEEMDSSMPIESILSSELTTLAHLSIVHVKKLYTFPAIQVLPQLELLSICGWPKLKSLPEQIQHLTYLTFLTISEFDGVEAIPEWFGKLASLDYLVFADCKNLMHLPSIEARQRLTKLDKLAIWGCDLLKERCMEETGPEWPKIC